MNERSKASPSKKKLCGKESASRIARLRKDAEALSPKELERLIAHLQKRLEDIRSCVGRVLETEIKGKTTPEKAKEVMGEGNFFGAEAVEKAFGVKFTKKQVPSIPFSKQELERAKERGQMLVLRVDKGADGNSLTMKNMQENVALQIAFEGEGKLLYGTNWYKDEEFFTGESPRAGWALVGKNVLQDSTSKNDLEQTEVLAQEVRMVFNGKVIPLKVASALKQFEDQKEEIRGLLGTDWKKAVEALSKLDLNKLFRRRPAEIIYDLVTVLRNSDHRLLGDMYERTSRLSSDGSLVTLGEFDDCGVSVGGWDPNNGYPSLGVSFSRSQ